MLFACKLLCDFKTSIDYATKTSNPIHFTVPDEKMLSYEIMTIKWWYVNKKYALSYIYNSGLTVDVHDKSTTQNLVILH